ncbi:hypothetical protein GCM10009801_33460 [Streptomyces albiaxialis]|uniref:Glutathionylspermidine synthase pre-ATP-grasp-like domain-containing protein n=1 Tax=Streptomyces albiaxialis TaxID=329523 RepID=A0ABP5HHU0_9ACTN
MTEPGPAPFFHAPAPGRTDTRPEPPRRRPPGEIAALLREEVPGTGGSALPARPFVLPRRSYDELFGISRLVLALLRRAALARGTSWPARLAALGARSEDHPLLSGMDNTETGYCSLMARADVVVGADGPRLLDFHVGGAFPGAVETSGLARVWGRVYGAGDGPPFAGHDPLATRAEAFAEVCARRRLPRAVAVLGRAEDLDPHADAGENPKAGARYAEREVAGFRERGFAADFFEPGALPEALGRPARLRYPLGLCRFSPTAWARAGLDTGPVRDAQRAGLLLLPPQSGGLLADRRVLALVSAGLPWMTRGERELTDRWLPWTRPTLAGRTPWRDGERELPDAVLADREAYVLKSAVRDAGHVLVGRRTDEARWRRAVEDAFRRGDGVVQEYVEPLSCPLELTDGETVWTAPVTPVFGPMLFGGRPGGCWGRYALPGSPAPAGHNAVPAHNAVLADAAPGRSAGTGVSAPGARGAARRSR